MCTKRAPLACASSIIRGQPARGRENSGEVRERRRSERIGIPSRKATTPVCIIARNSDGSAASFTHYLPAISVVIVAIRSTSDLLCVLLLEASPPPRRSRWWISGNPIVTRSGPENAADRHVLIARRGIRASSSPGAGQADSDFASHRLISRRRSGRLTMRQVIRYREAV